VFLVTSLKNVFVHSRLLYTGVIIDNL